MIRGDRPRALAFGSRALQVVRKAGLTFIGPAVLATEAALVDDEVTSHALLKEAEDILDAGCVAHNHFWFAQIAIRQALTASDWDRAERYASRLENYTRQEPLPWSTYLIARGRALASWGRGDRGAACVAELERLRSMAEERHLLLDLAELNAAIGATHNSIGTPS